VRRTPLVLVAVLSAAALLSACGDAAEPNAAKINSTGVNRSDFEDELKTITDNKVFTTALKKQQAAAGQAAPNLKPTEGGVSSVLANSWLNSTLNQALVDRAVARRHLKVTAKNRSDAKTAAESTFVSAKAFDAFPRAFRDLVIGRGARIEALRESLPQPVAATDAVLQQILDTTKSQYCPSGKVVAHILVKTKEEADAIEAQLAQGADFATLAKEKSTDTGSGATGGLVACTDTQQYQQLDQTFRAAADATPLGSISAPVQTQFGYHIIKVAPWDLANARPVIEQAYAQQQENPLTAFINRALLGSKIWVDPRYGTVKRTKQTVTVVPPKAPNPQSRPGSATTTTSSPTGAPAP
jgi:parvulin-like peptidyl-prolyl isomerase